MNKHGKNPQDDAHLAVPSRPHFHNGVGDHSQAQAGGDAEGQRHRKNRQEGWEGFGEVCPLNLRDGLGHERAHQDQCGSCREGGDGSGHRREEDGYGNRSATTTLLRPVRAPAATPAALSM